MKWNIRLICLFGLLLNMDSFALSQDHANMSQTENDSKLESYVEKLSELSSRARANVYFPNHQSIFAGVQVGFVNVGKGNLTFLRRDMVASGRIPLVLARVYDSAGTGDTDFGPGWMLSAAESVAVTDHLARLTSENGTVIEFIEAEPDTFELRQGRPSDYLRLVRPSPDILRAQLRSDMVKEYKRISGLFRLTTVTDANGNQIRFTYTNGGRAAAAQRDADGGHVGRALRRVAHRDRRRDPPGDLDADRVL
ncbi:MAG TPA: DUF6531 domain-containing protein, partial [Candidatus Angelobacter sp.]